MCDTATHCPLLQILLRTPYYLQHGGPFERNCLFCQKNDEFQEVGVFVMKQSQGFNLRRHERREKSFKMGLRRLESVFT